MKNKKTLPIIIGIVVLIAVVIAIVLFQNGTTQQYQGIKAGSNATTGSTNE